MANFAAIMALLLILGTLCATPSKAPKEDSESIDNSSQNKKQ